MTEVTQADPWECFSDTSYYDMWCVRLKTDRIFGSGIHVMRQEEAEYLRDFLNARTTAEAAKDARIAELEAKLAESEQRFNDCRTALLATGASLAEARAELGELEAENARLRKDKARLDWLESEMNDVRWVSGHGTEMCSPSDEVGVRIVSHHMAEPCERIEAENWNEDLRSAIDEARAALQEIKHG